MEEKHQEYLGDGVYASFDGYQILLRANDPHTLNVIALDSEVLAALDRYKKYLEENVIER